MTGRSDNEPATGVRLDSWLWAARFFKTRSLAKAAILGGKVLLDGERVKPAREIQVGQQLSVRRGDTTQIVVVEGLSRHRGPAPVAATLYQETEDSIETRETATSRRRMERAGLTVPAGRPDKRGRRALEKLKHQTGPQSGDGATHGREDT